MNDASPGAAPAAASPAAPPQLRPAAPGLAAAPPAAVAAPSPTDALVERWWDDFFPGSPVAQSTAAWNTAFAAKQELKRRLQNLQKGQ
jgi:hypothetical protein